MNIIKYLHDKTVCPECGRLLVKDMSGEIYCEFCGLLVLDNSFMSSELLDYALNIEKIVKKNDLVYIGRNSDGLKLFSL